MIISTLNTDEVVGIDKNTTQVGYVTVHGIMGTHKSF